MIGSHPNPVRSRSILLGALGCYRSVLVTGAQRGGTALVSRMLAHDLGLDVVDGDKHHNNVGRVLTMLSGRDPVVVHGPGFALHLDDLPNMPGVCVVWVLHDRDSLISDPDWQEWAARFEPGQLGAYRRRWPGLKGARICDVRLDAWRRYQRPALSCGWLEVEYASAYVSEHELFGKPEANDEEADPYLWDQLSLWSGDRP